MSVRRLAEKQPPSFAFTPENLEWAKARIAKYPPGRQHSAVIPLLWRAQEQSGGWLPQKAIELVADMLGMAKIRAPSYAHLQAMDFLSRGHMLADVCARSWVRSTSYLERSTDELSSAREANSSSPCKGSAASRCSRTPEKTTKARRSSYK